MKYVAEIIFGKDQVEKFHNNEPLNDFEKTIHLKKYIFKTRKQRNAFYKGIGEAMGWLDFKIIKEFKQKTNKKKEEDYKFDYRAFICQYYPKYHHCNNVLLSDILTKKLYGEEICEDDEEYIKDWDIKKELFKIDKELLCKAFENYFNKMHPEIITLKKNKNS